MGESEDGCRLRSGRFWLLGLRGSYELLNLARQDSQLGGHCGGESVLALREDCHYLTEG